jgi:hypothetical protein
MLRILVTGSRDWWDVDTVRRAIFRELYEMKCPHQWATLIHGDCPTGADRIADDYAKTFGMRVERFPADWARFGKSAGFKRNAAMVEQRPDVCLAFIRANSRGASMTAALAEKASIPTVRYVA